MDVLTPEQRRKNMQAIKSKETKAEIALAKALWAKGHRYRKQIKKSLVILTSHFQNADLPFLLTMSIFMDTIGRLKSTV